MKLPVNPVTDVFVGGQRQRKVADLAQAVRELTENYLGPNVAGQGKIVKVKVIIQVKEEERPEYTTLQEQAAIDELTELSINAGPCW